MKAPTPFFSVADLTENMDRNALKDDENFFDLTENMDTNALEDDENFVESEQPEISESFVCCVCL